MSRRPTDNPVTANDRGVSRGVPRAKRWSEAPIRTRFGRIVAFADVVPGEPPTSATYFTRDNLTPVPTWTVDTSVIALVSCRGFYGVGFTVPAGWTVLEQGLTGDADWGIDWVLAYIPSVNGTEGTTFTVNGPGHGLSSVYCSGWVITGGQGGSWSYISGASHVGAILTDGQFTPTAPNPAWGKWFQLNAVSAVYNSGGYPAPPDSGGWYGRLLGSVDNWALSDFPVTPWTGTYYYATIGAYGPPSSKSFAVGWIP